MHRSMMLQVSTTKWLANFPQSMFKNSLLIKAWCRGLDLRTILASFASIWLNSSISFIYFQAIWYVYKNVLIIHDKGKKSLILTILFILLSSFFLFSVAFHQTFDRHMRNSECLARCCCNKFCFPPPPPIMCCNWKTAYVSFI